VNLLSLFDNARTIKEYPAGETIFVEGQPRDVMYVVLGGEVDIQHHGRSIYTAGPGELVGEMAMIDSQGRSANAVALSPCRLAVVDEKQFLFMVQETPNFALEVMRVLVGRLRRQEMTHITA
jgi:CRP/FNR family transcriptional regulator, cyclic AMP receptor protein